MRTADERIAAVRRHSKRLRRRRNDRALAVIACFIAISLIDLTGRCAMGELAFTDTPGRSLFGAASLFGSSVGGYVLVAVVSFAVAVLLTACIMMRRSAVQKDKDDTHERDAKG